MFDGILDVLESIGKNQYFQFVVQVFTGAVGRLQAGKFTRGRVPTACGVDLRGDEKMKERRAQWV